MNDETGQQSAYTPPGSGAVPRGDQTGASTNSDDTAGASVDSVHELELLREAATRGDADAQHELGLYYGLRDSVDKNPVEAVHWYRQAAKQGHCDAQCMLALCYEQGSGVPLDHEAALPWFKKSAAGGNACARFYYGSHLSLSDCPRDEAEGVKLLQLSAEAGYADAQCVLAIYYQCGLCVAKDLSKAVERYRDAAYQGHTNAQYRLAMLLDDVDGVTENPVEAAHWYLQAARGASRSSV